MTAVETPHAAAHRWAEPDGLLPRGHVVVLGGRGESAAVYERFGARLAADAYRVIAFGEHDAAAIDDVAQTVRAWIDQTPAVPEGFPLRLTIAGSDTGAVTALRLARRFDDLDALVLAGYPSTTAASHPRDWDDELAERTTCPVHRGRLDADAGSERGRYDADLDVADVPTSLGDVLVPVLALHGGADAISPFDGARDVYASAPDARIWRIDGAKHDVLNDGAHRTVAATVVQFLESRRSPTRQPVAVQVA